MGIISRIKSIVRKPKPTYNVYIPSPSEQQKGKTNPKSYPTNFYGPIEKTAVKVDSPQVTTDVQYGGYRGGGGGSRGSSGTTPTPTTAPPGSSQFIIDQQRQEALKQIERQREVEQSRQQQQQQDLLVTKARISASGRVTIGNRTYSGTANLPAKFGGGTANEFVRRQRERAIEEKIISQSQYGKADLEVKYVEEKPKQTITDFSLTDEETKQRPTPKKQTLYQNLANIKNFPSLSQQGLINLAMKEVRIPLFTIGGYVPPGKSITTGEIATELKTKGTGGEIASVFIPRTWGEVGLITATAGAYSWGSPAVRVGISAGTTYLGTKGALNKDLTKGERIGSGIIGGLGLAGGVFEISPYVKGGLAKLSPKYKPVTTEQSFSVVKNIKGQKGTFDIGLIKPGDKPTGNIPAFESTAYGFSRGYQKSYIGTKGTLTTSARNLVGLKNIYLKKPIKITSKETGIGFSGKPEQFGAFFTPYDIKTGVPQTRVSRLGSTQSVKDFFFGFNKDSKLSFKFTPDNTQFVVVEGGKITTTGKGGTFKFGGKLSSELEATLIPGSKLYSPKKIGVTTISGKKVDIYSATTGVSGLPSTQTPTIPKGTTSSSATSTQVSASGLFGSVSATGLSKGSVKTETSSATTSTPTSSISLSPPRITSISSPPTRRSSGGISSPRQRPSLTTPISYPKIKTYKPTISPRPSPKRKPSTTTYFSKSITSPRIPNFYSKPSMTKRQRPLKLNYKPIRSKQPRQSAVVFGKRFGQWKPIGRASNTLKAFDIGKRWASSTLGASFKVKGLGSLPKTPKGFRKSKKEKGVFVEKREKRLSMQPELTEISLFRKSKKRKSLF